MDSYSLEGLILSDPNIALRHYGHRLSDEQFSVCFRHGIAHALQYFPERVTDELFASIPELEIGNALQHLPERFSDADFDRHIRQFSWSALCFATQRMTPNQIDACIEIDPFVALEQIPGLIPETTLLRLANTVPDHIVAMRGHPTVHHYLPLMLRLLPLIDQMPPALQRQIRQTVAEAI